MDPTGAFYIPDFFRLASLAVAIAAGLIAAASYWRRYHGPSVAASMSRTSTPGKIIYRDAPTVRVVESQRVDRLRKVARLAAGEFVDVVEPRATPGPRFRVTLKRIVDCEGGAVAHIAVEYGGVAVSCGPLVEEIAFNEFALPRATRDEPRNSVYHYQEKGDSLEFMRIKLRAIDAAEGWADIDVMQVAGCWPAG